LLDNIVLGERSQLFRKTVSAVMLSLLIISTLTLSLKIQLVRADGGAITINADGSINPSTAPLYTADNVTYTLMGNISTVGGDGIDVERSNIIIDGNGCTVLGNQSGYGLSLIDVGNVTIENSNIENFTTGIYLNSSNNIVSENNVTANTFYGIQLDESSNNNIVSGNNATANWFGFLLYGSYNIVTGNDATANVDGIVTNFGSNNSISYNNVTKSDQSGIWVYYSSNNTVNGNTATANKDSGISVGSSPNNIVIGNDATANEGLGISIERSPNNVVSGNNVTANGLDGINIFYSSNNTVNRNYITANNANGIYLDYACSNNVISGNNVTANALIGIEIYSSSNNTIFHNDFKGTPTNNTIQVSSYNSTNTWDNGYPSGGNYWSNYTGTDNYRGPFQNQTGSDEIGDSPYALDANNIDHYPLTKPYSPNMFGDINGDGKVDLTDLVLLANAYGSRPGDAKWNANADIDGNGIVGLSDLVIMALHYGQHYP